MAAERRVRRVGGTRLPSRTDAPGLAYSSLNATVEDTMEDQNQREPLASPPAMSLNDAIDAIVADEQAAAPTQLRVVPEFDSEHARVIKPIPITIGGKDRTLRLPFRSLKRFQQKTGLSAWDAGRVWAFPPDPDMIVALLWAGLLHEEPDLTLEEVETWDELEFGNIHFIRGKLDACWGENQPQVEVTANGSADPNPKRTAGRSTG